MFDYSKYEVTRETTREYTFDLIPGRPSIWVAPAHDSNTDFRNERLAIRIKRGNELAKQPRPAEPVPETPESVAAELDEDREADRKMIAKACGRAWGRAPVATDGTRPEFSAETCHAFLKALPNHMLDPFRAFVANLYNFVEIPPIDGTEAGN